MSVNPDLLLSLCLLFNAQKIASLYCQGLIKIAMLYVISLISLLICVSISIGNPPDAWGDQTGVRAIKYVEVQTP